MGATGYGYYRATIFPCMFIGYALFFFNRKTFSFVMPSVMEEIQLDKDDLGLITSSQTWPTPSVSHQRRAVGPDQRPLALLHRPLLGGGINVAFSWSSTVPMFSLLWFINGLGQGCGWPPCGKVLRKWFEPSQFGTWWSVMSCSMNLAGSLGPILVTVLLQYYDWRTILTMSGIVCASFSFVCVLFVKNEPKDVGLPSIQAAAKKGAKAGGNSESTLKEFLLSPFLWVLSLGYLVVFGVKTAATDWGLLFLIQDKGQTVLMGSTYMSALEVGGFVGSLAAGLLSDRAVSRQGLGTHGNPRHGLLLFMMSGMCVSMYLFRVTITPEIPQVTAPLINTVHGINMCRIETSPEIMVCPQEAPLWVQPVNVLLRISVEPLTLFLNTLCSVAVGAFMAGLPFSSIAKQHSWDMAFWVAEVIMASATIGFFLVRNMRTKMGRIAEKMD
ncbi:hypothetical protein F7725_007307 [Dissostichus mawsoni]|uniref:Glucose-6-phosphate translocase n=1 Tax=Dissostichus mawsoni TaxID=36200 RepID=A0A7J5XWF7_DISMA|nr:hypothetical protein F7725_007307 [Dissostichus mawsoni]